MLKPLDLQTIMPRTVDMQRMQQAANTRPVTEQQDASRETVKVSQMRQEQVQSNEGSAGTDLIREKESENKKNRERRYRHYNQDKTITEETDASEKEADSDRGQHIDIKI